MSLAYIIANYNIKGAKAIDVWTKYKSNLRDYYRRKEDFDSVNNDTLISGEALMLTERYASIYHGEKKYNYLSQNDLKRFRQ